MNIERRQIGWNFWLQWMAATVGSLALAAEVVRRLFPAIFGLNVPTVVVTGLVVMGLVATAQGLILQRYGVPLRAWILATVIGSIFIIALAALAPLSSQPYEVREHRADGSVRIWTREEIMPGRVGAMIAIADGAVGHGTPMHGSVAVGSLGSGVYIGDFDTIPSILIVWILGGTSVGIVQWLVLKRYINRASIWIPATIFAKIAAGISTYIVLGLIRDLVTSLEVPLTVSISGMGVYSAVQGAVTGMVLVQIVRRSLAHKEGAHIAPLQ